MKGAANSIMAKQQTALEELDNPLPAEESEPEEETADKDAVDVLVDTMLCEWTPEPDAEGRITVYLSGVFEFVVHEGKDDEGKLEYTSSLFRGKQDELSLALRRAVENVGKRCFNRRYYELNPKEIKPRKPRETKADVLADRDLYKRQLDVIQDALERRKNGEPEFQPDWQAAGVPAPDFWQ